MTVYTPMVPRSCARITAFLSDDGNDDRGNEGRGNDKDEDENEDKDEDEERADANKDEDTNSLPKLKAPDFNALSGDEGDIVRVKRSRLPTANLEEGWSTPEPPHAEKTTLRINTRAGGKARLNMVCQKS